MTIAPAGPRPRKMSKATRKWHIQAPTVELGDDFRFSEIKCELPYKQALEREIDPWKAGGLPHRERVNSGPSPSAKLPKRGEGRWSFGSVGLKEATP